jgi:hypothetical protein
VVRHLLGERHEGHREPGDLPVIRRTTGVTAVAVLAGALVAGCAGQAAPEKDTGDGRLALLSGRDDHGLVQLDEVPLYDVANGSHVVGTVHDGTLVRVVERDHMAMHVSTVEGPSTSGWVDDFYLRGEVRLVGAPPDCSVAIGDHRAEGGRLVLVYAVKDSRVLVQTVPTTEPTPPPELRGWVERDEVQELPPQGRKCGAYPPGSKHTHNIPGPQ